VYGSWCWLLMDMLLRFVLCLPSIFPLLSRSTGCPCLL
jgi:hypothetical protein